MLQAHHISNYQFNAFIKKIVEQNKIRLIDKKINSTFMNSVSLTIARLPNILIVVKNSPFPEKLCIFAVVMQLRNNFKGL